MAKNPKPLRKKRDYLSSGDIKASREFFDWLEIPLDDEAKAAFEACSTDPQAQANREELKRQLAKIFAENKEHPALQDEVFKPIFNWINENQ